MFSDSLPETQNYKLNGRALFAFHEAGHAVLDHMLLGRRVKWIDLDWTRGGAKTATEDYRIHSSITDERAIDEVATVSAGPFAEAMAADLGLVRGAPTSIRAREFTGDRQEFTMVFYALRSAGRVRDEEDFRTRYVMPGVDKTQNLLQRWWPAVEALAEALVTYGRLSGWEVRKIIKERQPRANGESKMLRGEGTSG